MIFRELDDSGDWLFGKGSNNFLRGNDAIGLNIKTRLLSWVNDCFFALDAGIDWINRMGLKNQQDLLSTELKSLILKSVGVTGINSLSVDLTGRDFTASYDINTIYTLNYQNQVESAT